MGRFREQPFLLVKAPAGRTCPYPGRNRVDIAEEPVALPNTSLVRGLLRDGSLQLVTPKAKKTVRESGRSK